MLISSEGARDGERKKEKPVSCPEFGAEKNEMEDKRGETEGSGEEDLTPSAAAVHRSCRNEL